MINDEEAVAIAKAITPYVISELNNSPEFKRMPQIQGATVISVNGNKATVRLPLSDPKYDLVDVPIKTSETIIANDNVFIMYWGSLTNVNIVMKNSI